MFGFSFPELVVLVVVAVVVIGPKDMPKVLRRVGQWAGKARRMASELRAQSGIDDVLRGEGLTDDINEIRRLARGELDGVVQAARVDLNSPTAARPRPVPPPPAQLPAAHDPYARPDLVIERDREYPREGADGFSALPDTALVYAETLPRSKLADDPLYVTGDASAAPSAAPEPPATEPTAATTEPTTTEPSHP